MDYAPDWPDPPLVTHAIFESPWLVCIALLTTAVALTLVGYRRAQRGPVLAGAVAAGLAVLVVVIASLVTTGRERMLDRTRKLVQAAIVPVNLDAFGEILSRDVEFFGRGYDQILATLDRSTDRWRVRQAYITRLAVHQDSETRGQTYLSVVTRLDTSLGGGSAQTRWLLHWRRESDDRWRISRIEWLTLNDRDAREGDLP
jgi:hypothetical protein